MNPKLLVKWSGKKSLCKVQFMQPLIYIVRVHTAI